jgi:hypothetical protein
MEMVETGETYGLDQDPAQDPNEDEEVTTYGDCSTCQARIAS